MNAFTILMLSFIAYFVPSLIAGLRHHNNLNSIIALNLLLGWTVIGWIGALVWSLANANRTTAQQPEEEPQPQAVIIPDATQAAVEHLRRTIEQCHAVCSDATSILLTAAQADGKISRDDLRIIVNFCNKHGADIPKDWEQPLKHLNSGITMRADGDRTCPESFNQLAGRPLLYLNALYGALYAMTLGAKRANPTADQLISRLEQAIAERSAQPADDPQPSIILPPQPLPHVERETPPPAKPMTWVDQAKAELAAERKR